MSLGIEPHVGHNSQYCCWMVSVMACDAILHG